MRFEPKPVHISQVFHDVPITELSRRGAGIARIHGLVIFVPETKVGERRNIIITKIGPSYAEAAVLDGEP